MSHVLTTQERKVFNQAASIVAKGIKPDSRTLNVIKLWLKEPSHKVGVHEIALVRRFSAEADAPVPSQNGAKTAARIKQAMAKPKAAKKHGVDAFMHAADPTAKAAFSGVTVTLETVDDEAAVKMLADTENAGFHNRSISKGRIERYAADMTSGRWRVNGDTVVLGPKGEVLNGQHRLHAIIDSSSKIPMMIIHGIPREAFASIDQGKARTGADVLGIVGINDKNATAAALRFLMIYDVKGPAMITDTNSGARAPFTNEMVLQWHRDNPGISKSSSYARACGKLLPRSATTFSHFVFSRIDRDKANWFFERLSDGVGLKPGDPIYALRERCIRERGIKHKATIRTATYIYLTFRAWNAMRAGKSMTRLEVAEGFVLPKAL